MTNQQQWMRDVLGLARISFEAGVKGMDTFHEQIEKALQMAMEAAKVPEQTRTTAAGWLDNMKKGRQGYIDAVEEGLARLERQFSGDDKKSG